MKKKKTNQTNRYPDHRVILSSSSHARQAIRSVLIFYPIHWLIVVGIFLLFFLPKNTTSPVSFLLPPLFFLCLTFFNYHSTISHPLSHDYDDMQIKKQKLQQESGYESKEEDKISSDLHTKHTSTCTLRISIVNMQKCLLVPDLSCHSTSFLFEHLTRACVCVFVFAC